MAPSSRRTVFQDRFAPNGRGPFDEDSRALRDERYKLLQMANGREARDAVRDGVLRTNGYPGVSGVLSMGVDGNAHKRPFLIGVERGHLSQIN